MMKRAMGLLLAVMMMLTMVISANAAAFTDIEGKDCANAVEVLTTLGVLEGRSETEFAPDAGLTRAEMATILVRLMGSEGAKVSEDIFTDVSSNHWAYSNIAIAYKSGLILGMGDGTFAPDINVTAVQMVKMLICALGYDVQAEQQGGYPSGYYAKAAQLGLLDGVTTEMNANATRGIMAMVLYNTIDVPLFDQATFGQGASGVYVESDDTLLSRYMDIHAVEGTVTANYLTSLVASDRACASDEIAINKVVYEMGDTAADGFLGMKVKAYYTGTRTSDVAELLHVAPAKVAKSFDFVSADIAAETTAKKFVYDVDGKEKTIAIEDDATLVVNGQVKETAITAADLKPALGTVTLVCNNGSSADVIKVWNYTNYVAQSKNADKKEVYLMNEVDPLVIDPTDKTVRADFITADGAAFDASNVEKWNVISIAKSEDGKVMRVVKNNATVSGKIAEKDEKSVVIDGVEYDVAAGIEVPDVNTTAKFYMDFMGNIAVMDTNIATGLKYGYLVGAEYAKGIDGTASFKIFTQEGEMKTFPAAERVRVNNNNRENTEVIEYIPEKTKYTATGGSAGRTIRQLIKYSVNADGAINEIATAANATGSVDEHAGDAGFNMVLNLNNGGYNQKLVQTSAGATMTIDGSQTQYIHNLRLLGANMIVGASTLIFQVPEENAADDEYKVIPASNFPHRVALPFVTAYDLSETYSLGAICWDMGPLGENTADKEAKYWSSMETPHGLITAISKILNSDMEPEYNITLVDWTGNVQKVKAKETLVCGTKVANVATKIENDKYQLANGSMKDSGGIYVGKLQPGDVIRFEKDNAGYLTVAAITYRASDPGLKHYSVTQGGGAQALGTASPYVGGDLLSNGIITHADANGIICKSTLVKPVTSGQPNLFETVGEITNVFPTPGKIMLYERDTQTTKAISVNDIVVGDEYLNLWRTITPFIFWVIR